MEYDLIRSALNSTLSIFGRLLLIVVVAVSIVQCGGNGDSVGTTPGQPTLTFAPIKTFRFSWTDVSDATHYKLLENPDGISGFTQVGDDIPQGTRVVDHIVPLYARINAQYILQSCSSADCSDSDIVSVSGTLVDAIGYVKSSDMGRYNSLGRAVSLSADGNTLAVGALNVGTGIIIGPYMPNLGAVYVFIHEGASWSQQAYLKASDAEYGEFFGSSVSLSADGNVLAVGAPGEDSGATGIDGDQGDNSTPSAGAVYVFNRDSTSWVQQAYIKASNTDANDYFGRSVSLSADGNTLAIGADYEDSSATGIDGDQDDNSAPDSGAVYVFNRDSTSWAQQAYIKASNTDAGDGFGRSVSLSADANTLAIGADNEDSSATGIDGDQDDNSVPDSGAVHVYSRDGTSWSQQAYIKASNTENADLFGAFVGLSADGNTLAVGADGEDSSATAIDGDQDDNSSPDSGAVYVFSRESTSWAQQAYIKASNTDGNDLFGDSFGDAVSLSADGNTLAIGAPGESSSAIGIDGDQADNSASGAGAVYVFSRSDFNWSQQAYVKASNTDEGDSFGDAVSLSAAGDTLAVGAPVEGSSAIGIDGDQGDNSAFGAGAVYLY